MKVEVDKFNVNKPDFKTRLSNKGMEIEPCEVVIKREEVPVKSLVEMGKVRVVGWPVRFKERGKVREGEGVEE